MSSGASAPASRSDRPDERAWMTRALDLAVRGWGRVAPNPLVGAGVVAQDRVVGEGFHAEYGGPHAGGGAVEQAGAAAGRGTGYARASMRLGSAVLRP